MLPKRGAHECEARCSRTSELLLAVVELSLRVEERQVFQGVWKMDGRGVKAVVLLLLSWLLRESSYLESRPRHPEAGWIGRSDTTP